MGFLFAAHLPESYAAVGVGRGPRGGETPPAGTGGGLIRRGGSHLIGGFTGGSVLARAYQQHNKGGLLGEDHGQQSQVAQRNTNPDGAAAPVPAADSSKLTPSNDNNGALPVSFLQSLTDFWTKKPKGGNEPQIVDTVRQHFFTAFGGLGR